MSYNGLPSEASEDRGLFVDKIYGEMNNNVTRNASDRKKRKACFLQLVERNKELSEIEKQFSFSA